MLKSADARRGGAGRGLWLALGLWAVLLGAGLVGLMAYGRTGAGPGADGAAWAQEVAASRPRMMVTVYAHPKCPCTRATMVVLERLAALAGRDVEIEVLFYRPAEKADAWAWGETWRMAGAIPGVRVMTDPDGVEAARAGAWASGHAVARDATGRVVFSGGITDERSHGGFGAAAEALLECMRGARDEVRTPVFGCEIGGGDGARLAGAGGGS